tara:strand:- start:481 stop:1839 length:1359 start_codon:yes stop_codon:yes gene_type:complete
MNLLWYKHTDLRVKDHSALFNSFIGKNKVLVVFFVDPRFYDTMKFGHIKFDKYKERFMLESLENLYQKLKENRGHLNIYFDKPENKIPELVEKYDIKEIFSISDTTDEELKIIKKIKNNCKDIKYSEFWDNTLFDLESIPNKIPDVFTTFRKSVNINNIKDPIDFNLKKLKKCIEDVDNIEIIKDKIKQFNFETKFTGGEDKAWERLNYYFFENKLLSKYKKTRNGLLGMDYSSKFSPYLAFGNISARSIYQMIKSYEETIEKNDSTYWLHFELLWRDYFRFLSIKYGNKLFKLTGIKNRKIEWKPNNSKTIELFEKWKNGETGYPYVDANMIEMKSTGFMSNRGRQMVASFLVKDLKIDWRMGAEYFESILIDYDVASNYGNWNYASGVGTDPRDDRYFNVYKQAKNYDKDCEFILNWIPELKKYSKKDIINKKNLHSYHKPIVFIKNYYS